MLDEPEEFVEQVVHHFMEHRLRGKPRQGEHAMSNTERSQLWRAKHDVKAIAMAMLAELAARVHELREERWAAGVTVAQRISRQRNFPLAT